MATSFVLMAAMPPTKGHGDLIRFARNLSGYARVIIVTRAGEPYVEERYQAVKNEFSEDFLTEIQHIHLESLKAEGNPYWANVLQAHGFRPGDYLVTSEAWGAELAELLSGVFFPYDMARELRYTKAEGIRKDINSHWDWLMPSFQKLLQKRVVLFGAESIGKSTMTRALAAAYPQAVGVFEYARPLMEQTPRKLDTALMHGIWKGQKALQETVDEMRPNPRYIFLDTDLYSTVGYWEFWDPETVPAGLVRDAKALQADLYIFLKSNIPFEEDPLRYGGNQREKSDEYWMAVLERHGVPYEVIEASEHEARMTQAVKLIDSLAPKSIPYTRFD